MNPLPVLFADEPVVPREFTAIGLAPRRRVPYLLVPPRRRRPDVAALLLVGACLAAFDAGIYDDELPHDGDGDTIVVEVP